MRAVVESVAWDEGKATGVNVCKGKGPRTYFESATVSLWSVKNTNPEWDVVLVTNTEVPSDIAKVLNDFGAKVIKQPFEKFSFPFDLPWHLAYYKLCALDAVVKAGAYELLCMLDTDTWVRNSLDGLIEASGEGISMIDLHASLADENRQKMDSDLSELGLKVSRETTPFYGGELICGRLRALQSLLDGCLRVHEMMVSNGYVSDRGDEFLIYACASMGCLPSVIPANPYVARCWTGRYYSVPRWEGLAVLHLPSEKVYSFPWAYKRLAKVGEIDPAAFEKTAGLRHSRHPFSLPWMAKRLVDKFGELNPLA